MTLPELHAVLASSTRLTILGMLSEGQSLPVGQIALGLGMSMPATSANLHRLLRADVLEVEQKGASRLYSLRVPLHPVVVASLAARDGGTQMLAWCVTTEKGGK